ncbi:MAG TPA: hypothetical protein VL461_03765 [Dictyobacter sp.]|jgi:uncharacterized protein YukE|nr:hypothetical protein [Dictyobacter sp.]
MSITPLLQSTGSLNVLDLSNVTSLLPVVSNAQDTVQSLMSILSSLNCAVNNTLNGSAVQPFADCYPVWSQSLNNLHSDLEGLNQLIAQISNINLR